ncbi:MAG: hypothetical protein RBU30_10540 [Polyangia bacterium]|nr:hypothetical protein [Polyangia bacterium]
MIAKGSSSSLPLSPACLGVFVFALLWIALGTARPGVAKQPERPGQAPGKAGPRGATSPAADLPRALASQDIDGGARLKAVALAVAGLRVFVALADGRVRGFMAQRPVFWLSPPRPAKTLDASADGKSLLVTSAIGHNWVFDLTKPEPALHRRWERKTGLGQGLTADGGMLVRGDVRGQVRGYELAGYKLKWIAKGERVVISPDGRWALALQGQTLSLLEAANGRSHGSPLAASGPVVAMAVAQAERVAYLVRGSGGGGGGGGCELRLAGAGALKSPAPSPVPCHPEASLTYSPAGGLLAVAAGREAQLRDGRTGGLLARHQSEGGLLFAAPLDDSTYVVAGLGQGGRVTWFRLPRAAPAPPSPRHPSPQSPRPEGPARR